VLVELLLEELSLVEEVPVLFEEVPSLEVVPLVLEFDPQPELVDPPLWLLLALPCHIAAAKPCADRSVRLSNISATVGLAARCRLRLAER
jgi:hypothetical protein